MWSIPVNLFLMLALLTAVPAEDAATPCEPVESFFERDAPPSRPTLVRWARSHLGSDAARLVGALDWEQFSWSGSEGRYLAPPPSRSGWNVRLAVPEPFQLSASFALEPGACLTLQPYGELSTKEGALALVGPWRVELRLSAGGQTRTVPLTGIPQLVVVWGRKDGRPDARLIAEYPSKMFEFDLPLPKGTSEHTWNTLTRPRVSEDVQQLLLGLLARRDAPARQRQAAVTRVATVGQHFAGSAQRTLRDLLLKKRLAPREAAALDLVARASQAGGEAAFFSVDGDAPPRIWVDGQEVSGWVPRAKGFEVGTSMQGFVLVRAEWPGGEAQDFWAALGPGVRLHLETDQGPRQESPPEGARCVALEGSDADWSCDTKSVPRRGPLDCPSPAVLQSSIGLHSEQKGGAEAFLYFVPSLPGRYTFRWHGPHIDGSWAPGCDAP